MGAGMAQCLPPIDPMEPWESHPPQWACLRISTVGMIVGRTYWSLEMDKCSRLYWFARAAITNYHMLVSVERAVNKRNLSSRNSGGWPPRSRCQQVWLLRPHSLACKWPLPHCVLTWSLPLCPHTPGISLYVQISSSYKGPQFPWWLSW